VAYEQAISTAREQLRRAAAIKDRAAPLVDTQATLAASQAMMLLDALADDMDLAGGIGSRTAAVAARDAAQRLRSHL
jgi:cysteine synthase